MTSDSGQPKMEFLAMSEVGSPPALLSSVDGSNQLQSILIDSERVLFALPHNDRPCASESKLFILVEQASRLENDMGAHNTCVSLSCCGSTVRTVASPRAQGLCFLVLLQVLIIIPPPSNLQSHSILFDPEFQNLFI